MVDGGEGGVGEGGGGEGGGGEGGGGDGGGGDGGGEGGGGLGDGGGGDGGGGEGGGGDEGGCDGGGGGGDGGGGVGESGCSAARGEVASVPASRAAGSEMEAVAGSSGMNRGCIELYVNSLRSLLPLTRVLYWRELGSGLGLVLSHQHGLVLLGLLAGHLDPRSGLGAVDLGERGLLHLRGRVRIRVGVAQVGSG